MRKIYAVGIGERLSLSRVQLSDPTKLLTIDPAMAFDPAGDARLLQEQALFPSGLHGNDAEKLPCLKG